MFTLTSEDRTVLESLARERSREGEEADTTKILIDGFSLYGEEAILELKKKKNKTYVSHEEFFRDKCGSLIENIGFAGQTFEQAFSSANGRDWLCQLVRCTGAPASDVEDIVQDMSRKFWQAGWVERYNPLISSWRNFLLVPIQRYVNTYKLRKSKKVTTGAISLDRDDDTDNYGNTGASLLYALGESESPENDLIRQEVMEDWEDYLRSQKPIRTVVRRDFEKLCTLIYPGVSPDLSVSPGYELDVFFLQGGHYNSRVTTPELYDQGITPMVPNYLLVDYITEDPVDHVQYVDEVTGEYITQKDFPNPFYDPSVVVKEQRTWMDIYDLLMRGLQVEEIARELRMAPPSVPARIQRLEYLFRAFWLVSKKIPPESKIRAAKTYKCPNPECQQLDMTEREECRVCGADMRATVAEVRFDGYPWPRVYVTRETYERLGNRRQALVVQRCSLSIRI